MNHIKRAIILAAGLGNRMKPLTLSTPKPLVKVNGIRMIDSVVNALHANQIFEIYVVVGHLKEKFEEWVKEQSGITLIENPDYNSCNNISSLYYARNYLEDAIVLDGDQLINNKEMLFRDFQKSGYNSIWIEQETNEWVQQVEDGRVVSCSKTGGNRGWQLYSVSRWNQEDAKKLKKCLEREFEIQKNRQIYWDELALFLYKDDFDLGVYPMHANDVVEIDSLDELIEMDQSYIQYREGLK
ncbi:MAG: NTP transferase domain-containing protein [Anaeroplasmataceae bacterium]|nr:NTP transferase domain-containing protein [Anaeroplasmataceae bacterium]